MLKLQLPTIDIKSSKLCGYIRRHQLIISFGIIYEWILFIVTRAFVDVVLIETLVRSILLFQSSSYCSDFLFLFLVTRKHILISNMFL
jgi:hypothetical protein